MKRFRVTLWCTYSDAPPAHLGTGTFYCDTPADARECATDCWWDPRLETAGGSPTFDVTPLEDAEICSDCNGSGVAGYIGGTGQPCKTCKGKGTQPVHDGDEDEDEDGDMDVDVDRG